MGNQLKTEVVSCLADWAGGGAFGRLNSQTARVINGRTATSVNITSRRTWHLSLVRPDCMIRARFDEWLLGVSVVDNCWA